MIDEEATFKAFGYYSSALKPKSGKRIIAVCDGCGKMREISKNHYHPLCLSCSKKGKTHPMFGKHYSDKRNAQISAALKGHKHTEEAKAKISAALKGHKHTEEAKAKISAAKKGHKHTEEQKAKLSAAKKGKNNPMFGKCGANSPSWLGGKSFEPYCIKFNKIYKNHIRNLFGNKCFLCGKCEKDNGCALAVHHVNYNKQCGCDDTKCICVPLCRACHSKTGADRDYWQALIMEMLKPVEM